VQKFLLAIGVFCSDDNIIIRQRVIKIVWLSSRAVEINIHLFDFFVDLPQFALFLGISRLTSKERRWYFGFVFARDIRLHRTVFDRYDLCSFSNFRDFENKRYFVRSALTLKRTAPNHEPNKSVRNRRRAEKFQFRKPIRVHFSLIYKTRQNVHYSAP